VWGVRQKATKLKVWDRDSVRVPFSRNPHGPTLSKGTITKVGVPGLPLVIDKSRQKPRGLGQRRGEKDVVLDDLRVA